MSPCSLAAFLVIVDAYRHQCLWFITGMPGGNECYEMGFIPWCKWRRGKSNERSLTRAGKIVQQNKPNIQKPWREPGHSQPFFWRKKLPLLFIAGDGGDKALILPLELCSLCVNNPSLRHYLDILSQTLFTT